MLYNDLRASPKSFEYIEVTDYFPKVTPDDIENGYMVRYFTRQSNHTQGEIQEIDMQTSGKLSGNTLYKVVSFEWRIAGPLDDSIRVGNTPVLGVLSANKKTLDIADKNMPGMKYRLFNLTQFWQGK